MKGWLKNNKNLLIGCGVTVLISFFLMKSCNGNSERDARIDAVEANVEKLAQHQGRTDSIMIANDKALNNAINVLEARMNSAENDISDLQDSIAVHRTEIDSLKMGVDSIAKLQQKCPCINPKAAKKSAKKRPARPNNVPVCRDTVRAVVPGQVATGCGSNQNAAVVIGNNSSNNTVIINNGGAVKVPADTVKTTKTTRTVTGHCSSTLTVTTYVTNGYCM